MSKDYNMLFAGFGGQGILFAGKIVAYCGLLEDKQISWLPSYGPEMRGGTANCSICISDKPIGSPLVINPDILVAMNLPSLDKFIDNVNPGGTVILDSGLINKKPQRTDLNIYYIEATKLAEENNIKGLANMIILGKLLKETEFCSKKTIYKAIEKCVPAKKSHLLDLNKEAINIGFNL